MTTQTKPAPLTEVEPRRFTVPEYYAMAEAGILARDERVELLDGVIIKMAPIGNRHAASVGRFTRTLTGTVGDRAIVWVQNPVRLDDGVELQPDLALLREREDFYASGHPWPDDVLLLIEVVDSSADYDRNEKLPRYAEANIPEVWIAVIPEGIVEAHTEPVNGRYKVQRIFTPGDVIMPGCFPDIALAVSDLLPD